MKIVFLSVSVPAGLRCVQWAIPLLPGGGAGGRRAPKKQDQRTCRSRGRALPRRAEGDDEDPSTG